MSKVKINLPGVAKDEEVEVAFLGLFPNGKTSTVPQEQVDTWCALTGREWPADGTLGIPDLPDPDVEAHEAPGAAEAKGPGEQPPADADKKEGKG